MKNFKSLDEPGWFVGGFGLSQMRADHLWIDLKFKLSCAKLCIPITIFDSVPTYNLKLIWKTFQSLYESGWFLGGFGLSQMCADHLWIDLKSKLSRAKLCIPITMEQRTNASKCVGLAVLTACELFHWIYQNCLQFFPYCSPRLH